MTPFWQRHPERDVDVIGKVFSQSPGAGRVGERPVSGMSGRGRGGYRLVCASVVIRRPMRPVAAASDVDGPGAGEGSTSFRHAALGVQQHPLL